MIRLTTNPKESKKQYFLDCNKGDETKNLLETIKLLEQLANAKAKLKVNLLCSAKCLICQKDISEQDYKYKMISITNCKCSNYHKQCLSTAVKQSENKNIQSIINNLNNQYKCNISTCQENSFDHNNILQVASKYDVIIKNEVNVENEEVKNQKEDKNGEENQQAECPICYDDFDLNEGGLKLSCGCAFCSNCLVLQFKEELNAVDVDITKLKCTACLRPLEFSDVEKILKDQKEILEALERKNLKTFYINLLQSNPESAERLIVCQGKYLKDKTSGEIKYIQQSDLNSSRQGKKGVQCGENEQIIDCEFTFIQDFSILNGKRIHKCEKCQYKFCLYGCDSEHENMTCEGYIKHKQDNAAMSKEQWEALGYKFCPNCNTLTFREDGCNRITCTMCKQSYCYLCYFLAKTANEVYAHLQKVHGGYWGKQ